MRRVRAWQFVVAVGAALVSVALFASGAAVDRAMETLSDDDKSCLDCHATEESTKKFANGDSLKLAVDGAAFARSVHRESGCVGCHTAIKPADHPDKVRNFASARQYAVAQSEACRACHARVFRPYQASAHGILLRAGNAGAPLCADCHQPHQVMPASVKNNSKDACLNCHGDAEEQHGKWLPNAASHLNAVACAACHAPDALRKVDLRIFAGTQPLIDRDGALQFEQRARAADANHDGLDARELSALLADLESAGEEVSLRGHLELRSGIDAHELPPKARALRDCVKCHDESAAPFQFLTVSSLDADGRPVRYDAQKDVLSSALTWEALRGFYAIGGTRMKLLDILLGLGLLAGISVPVLHLLVRRMFRRRNDDGASK